MRYFICWNPEECDAAYEFLRTCELIATDIETIPFRKPAKGKTPEANYRRWKERPTSFIMTVVAYTGIRNDGSIRSFCFPLVMAKSLTANLPTHVDYIHATCGRINDLPIRFTLHNGVYDAAWFIRYAIPLRCYAYDSMTLWWSRYPDMPRRLDFVSSILLDDHQFWKQGRKETDFLQFCLYAMRDTESTLRITIHMLTWLYRDPQLRINFTEAHLRCLTGLGMGLKGMLTDEAVLEEMEDQLIKESEDALARARYILADPDFNPNSAPQKKELLYEVLGLRPRNAKGRYVADASKASTGAFVLRAVKHENFIVRRCVEAIQAVQEPSKQLSNVIGIRYMDNRFRQSYDGVGTTTSRFASRGDAFGFGSNGQNIRKKFRKFIRADADSFILELDFSAADDVFVSYESQEQKKIDVIEQGLDTHAFNVSHVFFTNWTYERVVEYKNSPDEKLSALVNHPITGVRQINKKLTHGCNYLMAAMTLLMSAGRDAIVAAAKELGHANAHEWTQAQLVDFCGMLEAKYRRFYPRFAREGEGSFYTDLRKEVTKTGGFTTIFNYKQHFYSSPKEDSTLRAIAATAGQANTAGRINMAMLELDQGIRKLHFRDDDAPDLDEPALFVNESMFGCSMRLQTHDSLTFNVNYKHPNWKEGVDRIFHVMRRPVVCKGRRVQLGIEADVQIHWGSKDHRVVASAADCETWLGEKGFI